MSRLQRAALILAGCLAVATQGCALKHGPAARKHNDVFLITVDNYPGLRSGYVQEYRMANPFHDSPLRPVTVEETEHRDGKKVKRRTNYYIWTNPITSPPPWRRGTGEEK